MKKIKLTKEKFAIVDDEDFSYLNQWNWYYGSNGYAERSQWHPRCNIFMHRVVNSTPIGLITDHINGDKLDNRKSNLRNVTKSQNASNMKSNTGSSSRYKGVSYMKERGKWRVTVKFDHIGSFDDELDAAKCYDVHAVKYFGEFARTNFGGNNVVSR